MSQSCIGTYSVSSSRSTLLSSSRVSGSLEAERQSVSFIPKEKKFLYMPKCIHFSNAKIVLLSFRFFQRLLAPQ